MCHMLLLFCAIYHYADGTGITITSMGSAPYYQNDTLDITCSFSGLSDFPISFGLQYIASNWNVKLGCRVEGQSQYVANVIGYPGLMDSPTTADCARIYQDFSPNQTFQLRVNFILIQIGNYECEYFGGRGKKGVSSPLQISTLWVPPASVGMTLMPESGVVTAGDVVSISCTSTGGSPASTFTYGIGSDPLSGATFVAESKHNGKSLYCLDTKHNRHLGAINKTRTERVLTVYFIEPDGAAVQRFVGNPCGQSWPSLECSVRFNSGGEPIVYGWSKNGMSFDHSHRSYEISDGNVTKSGTTDIYECTAKVTLLGSSQEVRKRFEIVWNSSAHDCIIAIQVDFAAGGSSKYTSIIAGTVVGIVAIAAVASLIVLCVKKKESGALLLCSAAGEGFDVEMQFRDAFWARNQIPAELSRNVEKSIIRAEDVQLGNVIGKGNFGKVVKAHMRNATTGTLCEVAVKCLKGDQLTSEHLESFLSEACLMMEFKHANILPLVGIIWEPAKSPLIVLPFMAHGDLKAYVQKVDLIFTLGDLLHFALQVAFGMEYLGTHKYVHRDLAARNCLVDSNNIVKIADFGLSLDVYNKEYFCSGNSQQVLPVKWMALESLTEGRFSSKTDVWSFGVVLWELITRGGTPYLSVPHSDMKSFIQRGGRLDCPAVCPLPIYEFMLRCWIETPQDRPSFSGIAQYLTTLLNATDTVSEEDVYARRLTKSVPNDYCRVYDQPYNTAYEQLNHLEEADHVHRNLLSAENKAN